MSSKKVDELRAIIERNARAAREVEQKAADRIRRLQTENAELRRDAAEIKRLWNDRAELAVDLKAARKDIERLEKENAELRERAHYAVVASDLSVERAEQAEAVLRHLHELIASPECDYYGPGLSDIAPEHTAGCLWRAAIERIKEQNDE